MTTISSATPVSPPPPTSRPHSGKGRMAEAIAQQEQNGALSSTDATALTSALGAIDSSLQADTSSTSGGSGTADASGGARLDPSAIKDRIDSLIGSQVSSGALTTDQAGELKNLFASHGRSVSGASESGAGSPPPSGPPPSDGDAADGTGSSTSSANDLLSTFIQQLQAAQSSSAGYAASGTTAAKPSSALLFDFNS